MLAIVDFDGTLVNSKQAHLHAYCDTLLFFDVPINLLPNNWFGRSTFEVMAEIMLGLHRPELSLEKLVLTKQEFARSRVRNLTLNQKLMEELETFNDRIIWSKSNEISINATLSNNRRECFFSHILHCRSHRAPKPNFILLKKFVEELGFPVGDCVIYDDLDILVQEAKLFGFKGVLVDDF